MWRNSWSSPCMMGSAISRASSFLCRLDFCVPDASFRGQIGRDSFIGFHTRQLRDGLFHFIEMLQEGFAMKHSFSHSFRCKSR